MVGTQPRFRTPWPLRTQGPACAQVSGLCCGCVAWPGPLFQRRLRGAVWPRCTVPGAQGPKLASPRSSVWGQRRPQVLAGQCLLVLYGACVVFAIFLLRCVTFSCGSQEFLTLCVCGHKSSEGRMSRCLLTCRCPSNHVSVLGDGSSFFSELQRPAH